MNINRHNYEPYFIDYLDGSLSEELKAELAVFLEKNPDLVEELGSLEEMGMELVPGPVGFPGKSQLKKREMPGGFIVPEIDERCIAWMEGDIPLQEQPAFQKELATNKNFQETLALYKNTKLKVDKSISFDEKTKLKKISLWTRHRRVFFTMASVAASLSLLISVFINTNRSVQRFTAPESTANVDQIKQQNPVPVTRDPGTRWLINQEDKREATRSAAFTKKQEETEVEKKTVTPESTNISKIQPRQTASLGFETSKEAHPVIPSAKKRQPKRKTGEDYLSLNEYALRKIKKNILQEEGQDKITLWDIAQASVRGISNLTGKKMELEKKPGKEGEVKYYAFNSKRISVMLPAKNK